MAAITAETKQLEHLLAGVAYSTTGDFEHTEITGLCSDSRKVQPGNMFAALKGLTCDGHNYVDRAVAAGCSALLVDKDWQHHFPGATKRVRVPIVEVEDTKTALGYIAANFYDHPHRQLTVIGITGTNGKTTTSFLAESHLGTWKSGKLIHLFLSKQIQIIACVINSIFCLTIASSASNLGKFASSSEESFSIFTIY